MADYRSSLSGVQMDNALMDMAEHNSEAFAVGERNGVPVGADDVTYHNNSKYWASFAADAVEGACIITDPNEDGNLVIEPPMVSENKWLYFNANTDRTDTNARKTAIATLYAEAKVTGIPVGCIRYVGGYYYSYIFTGRPTPSSSTEIIFAYEQTASDGNYAINIWVLNNGSWSLARTI